ncbi:unnamed protein product [Mytilus coruscus]|uniref:Mab-21-like HhH/H2TH-like domain-containing protein n=1 Tax=Mytilus coruscus TaxID=42192 RepID=A0A6J8BR12_MYTCO|nr:unnamed protein product [Mytilus coruscus]
MDTDPTNQEYKYMYGMRKVMYLQKYGVKSFPYRGKRRYKPSIFQSLDGGIVISNDVFGLTIRQFKRIFKSCLERRKTHEQWILNLRYPDKSSNEYLEYLQDCVYYTEDILPWPDNDLKDKYFYEHLVYTIGTEMNIRIRQRLLIIEDMVSNLFDSYITRISSGSLAEGLDLPGSESDVMYLIKTVDVIQNVQNIKHPIHHTTLVMESDNDHPGFTRLRLIAESEDDTLIIISEFCESTTNGEYVSISSHGPCLSDTDQNIDVAICLRSKSLPHIAIPWVRRRRHQWPPNVVIDKIVKYGCLLVPIGPRITSDGEYLFLWQKNNLICGLLNPATNISGYYKLLHFAESLQMFASSKFIIDACKYHRGIISQYVVQCLPPPTTISKTNNLHKRYHRHLQDGIRTDAVSGWLLYASYYYVTGQYNVTLRLAEYVLSRYKLGMVHLGCGIYKDESMNSYRRNVHSKISFKDRIKLATVDRVTYVWHSSLIPEELQLEVEEGSIFIQAIVLSYCLRFLCHHQLGDIFNRQQALHNLFLAVKDDCFVSLTEVSDSKTILGVCYEISEDMSNAYQCYDEALENDVYVCRSAKVRKSKLLLTLT